MYKNDYNKKVGMSEGIPKGISGENREGKVYKKIHELLLKEGYKFDKQLSCNECVRPSLTYWHKDGIGITIYER